ncbi:MAG: DUF5103 domain-containing protein [Bacteroidales bacterium]|nr:DUF5103 domain-containing protein [Bacteroidales bacterium]
MKKCVALVLVVVSLNVAAQRVSDSVWRSEVRTVSLTRDGIEGEPPVLTIGDGGKLVLRFDLMQASPRDLRCRIAHCNRDWQPDSLLPEEFMLGFDDESIDNMQFSFTTNVDYINYWHTVPPTYGSFVASGNYSLTVYLRNNPDSVFLTRRFYVSEGAARVATTLDRATATGGLMQNQEVNVTVQPDQMCQPQFLTVRVQQNGRTDNLRTLTFSGYDRGALAFSHRPENVFAGGNMFRFFDISNIHSPMYNVQQIERYGGQTFAMLRPLEDRSRKPFSSDRALMGGMKVNVYNRTNDATEADYVWVNFSLPMERPLLGGSLHIVGALTDWALDDRNLMEWNPRYKAYTARLFLKQGYYSYQLLYKPVGETEGQTATLEGDHFETPNRYTVFVYLRLPSDRYDRLIMVK